MSGNNPNKKSYSVVEMQITVITYDKNLASYYSSLQEGVDGFTVKLDQPDFSNIKGGYGIFGSYVKRTWVLKFTKEYLKQFGYN